MARFSEPIRVSGSAVGKSELSAIASVFERGYLGMGADVLEFEQLLTEYFGRPVVCVATGTAALQLAVQCIGIQPGDEILVPSLTYVAAFQAISATGGVPVAVDVLEHSLTMDPDDADRKITGNTRAIMPVYYGGGISGRQELRDLALGRNLRVIEDAAHAFGSVIDGSRVGSDGDITCFSFDPIKNLTAGEGGCVVSDDSDFVERVRDARLLGVMGDSKARNSEKRLYEFEVESQGWRYHMSNINAAIGKAQFAAFDDTAATRQKLAQIYNEVFAGHSDIAVLPYEYHGVVPHIYVVRFKDSVTRDRIKSDLLTNLNVETALHWYPNHYLSKYRDDSGTLKVTEDAFSRMLTLPLHTKLEEEQVQRIARHVVALLGEKENSVIKQELEDA
jgi:dTDP-4-amino-4,6-dideoxygalactose transaminase